MKSVGFTVIFPDEGGLVVYGTDQEQDQGLVFAGNEKEVFEYISKRIAKKKSEKSDAPREEQYTWDDAERL